MKGIVVILVLGLSFGVRADELKPFHFEVPPKSTQEQSSRPVCKFEGLKLPADAVVYAAGAYAGRDAGFQIDQSGHQATRFDIAVNSPTRPVALMLGAYEPTIWNLGWTPKTKIVAVLVSGYHRQVVAGLPSDVPVLISTFANRGPCGYFYIGRGRNAALNPKARALFGKAVELVFPGDKSGTIVVGKAIAAGDRLVTSASHPPESYQDPKAPLAGKAGLDDAVAKGLIRPAVRADAEAWVNAVAANAPAQDVPPIAGQGAPKPRRPSLYRAYVVLKPFTYPAGLYGANAATFFIAKGVPKPTGNPGHSAVYDFNTLSCRGALCGH